MSTIARHVCLLILVFSWVCREGWSLLLSKSGNNYHCFCFLLSFLETLSFCHLSPPPTPPAANTSNNQPQQSPWQMGRETDGSIERQQSKPEGNLNQSSGWGLLEAKFLQKLKPHPSSSFGIFFTRRWAFLGVDPTFFFFFKHLECWKGRERNPGALSIKFTFLLANAASVTNCTIWHKQSW